MPPYSYTSSAAHSFRATPTASPTTTTATQTLASTPVLRLRATAPPPQTTRRPRIQWAEDVVDNEGLGRKSSKVCCIYHAPGAVGESSSDECSSSSSSDSSSDGAQSTDDDGAAKMSGNREVKGKKKEERSPHNEDAQGENHEDSNGQQHAHKAKRKGKRRAANAYEKVPRTRRSTTMTMQANT